MLLWVCTVRKHLCDRRWAELRRVGQSWEGEKSWYELRKRWGELSGGEKRWEELKRWQEVRRVETSWEELRRGGQRWESPRRVEKSRDEVKRVMSWGGKRWNKFESCRKELRKLRRAEMVWEELRSGGQNWKGVRQNDDEFTGQSWKAARVRCISYAQTWSLDPIQRHTS